MPESRQIIPTSLESEIKKSYLDYAMSVIVGRALPDVRDGLKPVHRRVLYSMYEEGNDWNKAYKKSARIVGMVMSKYHPHGNLAIYDAIVRLAQDFSMRDPLIDGHGNFGSVDGDSPAAERYTEIRLARISHEIVADLDKDTVNFVANFDNTEMMPLVLPTKIPNLLVNGSSGIAVGMATNIPPHNLGEVLDALILLIDQPDCSLADILGLIHGPDFPTAGIVSGRSGIVDAYKTGRGKIYMRAKADFEHNDKLNKSTIIITELPYAVNKAKLCEKIGQLVREKKVDGITAIRDESNRKGMRVVIECRRGESAELILNQLFSLTPLQCVYGINMVCLDRDRPRCMPLMEILTAFIEHRREVVRRRLEFEVSKARKRAHILEGLAVAISNLDDVIQMIRSAGSPAEAKTALLAQRWSMAHFPLADLERDLLYVPNLYGDYGANDQGYQLSETQAQAILDLRLHRITGLERTKIIDEFKSIVDKIRELLAILGDYARFMAVIREELVEIKEKFATPRRTVINDEHCDLDDLDLIPDDPVVVTKSNQGYLKAQSVEEYKVQRRGGKGKSAGQTKVDDVIDSLWIATLHQDLLCFTNMGRVYKLPVRRIPLSSRAAKGRPANNYLPLQDGELIQEIMPVRDFSDDRYCVFATQCGLVKKVPLSAFANVRSSGIIAITMKPEDQLIGVVLMALDQDVMLFSSAGKAIRFKASDIRETGRTSQGVIGIRLKPAQKVITLIAVDPSQNLLMATENGYGKRTRVDEFSRIGRGGQGVIAINTSERNGTLVTAVQVADDHDFFLITNNGAIIRMAASTVSVLGRNTQGVRLIQLSDDRVVGCQVLESIEEVVSAEHENADVVVPLDSEVVDNTSHDE
ncbi:MAG: DNA gyrase subunit A [Legionellales bacterium]|nr:DNA gyrase subunit A [Legionellales bacterium]